MPAELDAALRLSHLRLKIRNKLQKMLIFFELWARHGRFSMPNWLPVFVGMWFYWGSFIEVVSAPRLRCSGLPRRRVETCGDEALNPEPARGRGNGYDCGLLRLYFLNVACRPYSK
jgi:hypothetical protein